MRRTARLSYRRAMGEAIDAVNSLIAVNAATPWALGVVFLLAVFDAAIPPLPSEAVVIALAAFGAASFSPNLVLLGAVAALGAWLGDNITYTLARHSPLRRLSGTQRPRLRRAFRFASRELDERGGAIIVVARYIPVGRVAVNVTAGASEFRRRRFMGLTAIATVTWAAYSVAVGALAGTWVEQYPLLGALGGIALAVVLGVGVDHVVRRLTVRTTAVDDDGEVADPVPVECAASAPRP